MVFLVLILAHRYAFFSLRLHGFIASREFPVGSEVTGNLVFVVTGAFVSVTTYFSLNDLSVNLFQSLFHYLRLENKKFSTFVNDVDGNLSRLAYRT